MDRDLPQATKMADFRITDIQNFPAQKEELFIKNWTNLKTNKNKCDLCCKLTRLLTES